MLLLLLHLLLQLLFNVVNAAIAAIAVASNKPEEEKNIHLSAIIIECYIEEGEERVREKKIEITTKHYYCNNICIHSLMYTYRYTHKNSFNSVSNINTKKKNVQLYLTFSLTDLQFVFLCIFG